MVSWKAKFETMWHNKIENRRINRDLSGRYKPKESRVIIAVPDNVEHKSKSTKYGKEWHFRIMPTIHNIDLTVMNIYAPNNNKIFLKQNKKYKWPYQLSFFGYKQQKPILAHLRQKEYIESHSWRFQS